MEEPQQEKQEFDQLVPHLQQAMSSEESDFLELDSCRYNAGFFIGYILPTSDCVGSTNYSPKLELSSTLKVSTKLAKSS